MKYLTLIVLFILVLNVNALSNESIKTLNETLYNGYKEYKTTLTPIKTLSDILTYGISGIILGLQGLTISVLIIVILIIELIIILLTFGIRKRKKSGIAELGKFLEYHAKIYGGVLTLFFRLLSGLGIWGFILIALGFIFIILTLIVDVLIFLFTIVYNLLEPVLTNLIDILVRLISIIP